MRKTKREGGRGGGKERSKRISKKIIKYKRGPGQEGTMIKKGH